MDRTRLIAEMYRGYLDAHERLVAGRRPGEIEALAAFSAALDEDTGFHFPSLGL